VSDLGRVREMSDDSTATVELAQIDAAELAELRSFIEVGLPAPTQRSLPAWIATWGPPVTRSSSFETTWLAGRSC
jgi:hypothetical protein